MKISERVSELLSRIEIMIDERTDRETGGWRDKVITIGPLPTLSDRALIIYTHYADRK